MARIRILVVEDSATVRNRIVEVLSRDPDLAVVGEAVDGQEGIELCRSLRPDAVTLDMMLPVMSGLAATEYIMAYCPTPILVVSSSTNRGELFRTYEALAAGALDVLEKPSGSEPPGDWERRLVAAVKMISRIKVITHPRGKLRRAMPAESERVSPAARDAPGEVRAIFIGASTGGPGAVVAILKGLATGFPLPILLVVHIGGTFADPFAEWLDGQSAFRATYAEGGEVISTLGARVLMAPPGRHMVVQDGRICLEQSPERHSCRPSVDVLFESAALDMGRGVGACLLTGMGRDGAQGLLQVRRAGGRTIAQDEQSCVVFGMPKEAIAIGAAEQVLSLDCIPKRLSEWAGVPVNRREGM